MLELFIVLVIMFTFAYLLSTWFGRYVDWLYYSIKPEWKIKLFILIPLFILMYLLGVIWLWVLM